MNPSKGSPSSGAVIMNADETRTTDATNVREHKTELTGCCGGPAPAGTSVCCAEDAAAKVSGGSGCDCGAPTVEPTRPKTSCCG